MRYFWNLRNRNTPASIDQPLRGEIDGDTLRLVLRRYLAGLPLLCDGDRFECWTEAQVEVVEEVRSLDWKKIKETVLKEEAELNMECDSLIRSLYWCSYLGTPSGKVYSPFTNSNLTPCPHCSTWRDEIGKEDEESLDLNTWCANPKILMSIVDAERARLVEIGEMLRAERELDGVEPSEFFKTDKWRQYIERQNATSMFPESCPACDGYGSHEASLDSVWYAEMERIAEREDLFIDCNSGDYFICASEPVNRNDADSVGDSEIEE
jgi:hypothetical protein